ncbi:hypothetical protein V1512DRAFT_248866 [Lipomyces arxii]|uniref:uncharacterized protein n=1 Tax=Lipomyces arxii TaxID=56418 RepID=UPI0034CF5F05
MSKPVIIALDWDAFYCSVEEHFDPRLRNVAFAVRQKGIVCTCNYAARALGVKKLQSLAVALKTVSDLIVVNGEDLSRYRDASKELWMFVRKMVWGGKVERLGLDELFLDVSDMIEYNLEFLRESQYDDFFFRLSRDDETGFSCTSAAVAGLYATQNMPDLTTEDGLRLILASQLCQHVRSRIFTEKGYTSSGGISTGKVLAKMAGAVHKPNVQTVLDPVFASEFLKEKDIGCIPGIGRKYRANILNSVYGSVDDVDASVDAIIRLVDETKLIGLFGDFLGKKIYHLLHGTDTTPVNPTPDIPTQISIEDTFGSLKTLPDVRSVLHELMTLLYERMQIDLMSFGTWTAHARTIRLSLRYRAAAYGVRTSKSDAVPSVIYSAAEKEEIVRAVVNKTLMPLFHKLVAEPRFDLALLNVAVVNIEKQPAFAEITGFLGKRQRVNDETELPKRIEFETEDGDDEDDDEEGYQTCEICGQRSLRFAVEAHRRFHEPE